VAVGSRAAVRVGGAGDLAERARECREHLAVEALGDQLGSAERVSDPLAAVGAESSGACLAVGRVGSALDEPVVLEVQEQRGAAGGRETGFEGERGLGDPVVRLEDEQQGQQLEAADSEGGLQAGSGAAGRARRRPASARTRCGGLGPASLIKPPGWRRGVVSCGDGRRRGDQDDAVCGWLQPGRFVTGVADLLGGLLAQRSGGEGGEAGRQPVQGSSAGDPVGVAVVDEAVQEPPGGAGVDRERVGDLVTVRGASASRSSAPTVRVTW
jgi:hypothetical protein